MTTTRLATFFAPLIVGLLIVGQPTQADDSWQGDWMLRLESSDTAAILGMLQLERKDDAWTAHVEGGPAEVTIDGNDIEVVVDSRDLEGFVFYRTLVGKFQGEKIAGTFSVSGENRKLPPGGSWTASRKLPEKPRAKPNPVDISGIWMPGPGIDFRKYSMDLTPGAEQWLEGYMFHYDQPNVRCVSPGIVAMSAWGGYPMEILETKDRVTFLYEVENSVRRIFMDGRPPHEYMPPSAMGFSTGYWDGQTLVIETSLIAANVRDFRGEPVSDEAEMVERYSLSEDGQTLSAILKLHDPANYERPPIRRRQWVRNPETEIFPYECDPDSFFRQMYDEDKLDMYFERWDRRL